MNSDTKDIGIDLGTTFSVIAVKGQVTLVEGYPRATYLPECDVSIIPTPIGDPTYPSVFWGDPQDPSRVLVGTDARQKAQEGEAPIMFSKREIGTNNPLRLHDRTFSAKEVATHILKYLKACAEQALGQPVRRAVVTHPAYFDPRQVQETREAAVAAGFDMSLPEQMMMEPAAAALAYAMGVEKDPLKVMTYDLGGGTFDVTVLERSQGVISMKAFDGNHLLGGYNFDRALVQWVLDRLKAKGRTIPYDENDPEHRARRARLLQLAESVKIKLTEQHNSKAWVDVRAQDILVDAEGRVVPILERINREEYAALIKDYLDETIRCCHSALGKAGMTAEELDDLLLVGGSTYGQWVIEAVQQAFGKEVHQYNPDLCVAAGASLRASELPAVASGSGLELVLDVPPTSALPRINIAGNLQRRAEGNTEGPELRTLRLLLTTPAAGTKEPDSITADGRFLFKDVALLEVDASEFSLQVSDERGMSRLVKTFAVHYAPEKAENTQINTVLPKPLYLETPEGMKPIADEGVPLPARRKITGTKIQEDSDLDLKVFQDGEKIATIEVGDLPPDAGVGCLVEITVEITPKNEMKANLTVYSRGNTVIVQRPLPPVQFPPLRLPDLAQLRDKFEVLEGQRQEREALSNDPEQRLLLGGKGAKLTRKLNRLFAEQEPDKQEIHVALKELDALVNPPPEDMNPPRAQFRRLIDNCQDMLATKGTDPAVAPMQQLLKRIEADGTDAYTTKNHKKWAVANENLAKLHGRIEKLMGGGDGGTQEELPPTPVLKEQCRQRVDQIRCKVRAQSDATHSLPKYETKIRPRLEKVDKALDQMLAAINKIDDSLPSKQALAQLQVALLRAPQLEKEIANVDKTIGDVKIESA